MDIKDIKELSEKGENEYDSNSNENLLSVPSANHKTGMEFRLEDVLECFNKPAHLRDTVFLVGGTVIRGKGNDVDIVIRGDDFSEEIKESLNFRLYRAFADYFNIEYDLVPEYLRISYSGAGGSFTDFLSLYNFSIVPTKSEERTIHKMSLDDKNEDKKFEILEKSKRRIIAGTIATNAVDAENEEITKEALSNIWKHFQKLPENYRNLMFAHSSSQIGHLIPSYRNRKEAFLDNKIYLIAELRTDLPLANDIWNNILKGDLHSFSIKINIPKPLKKNVKEICNNERCWTQIKDGRFIEVSLTESPANDECSDLQILSKEIK